MNQPNRLRQVTTATEMTNDMTSDTAVRLHSRIIGEGPPVLVLHGLLGMSDNWLPVANALSDHGYAAHLIDLRNHGISPHTDTHRYPDMCDDLLGYIEERELDTVHLIGHSMGGKLAMIFALLYPEKLGRMIVVDIAPAAYGDDNVTRHDRIIDAMLAIDPGAHRSRGSIKQQLKTALAEPGLATFLAKNIVRDSRSQRFVWKCNLPVLKKFLRHLHIGLGELEMYVPCPTPTLFIRGGESDYYRAGHDADRLHFFEDSSVVTLEGAGHWVHSDQPEKFLDAVLNFLPPGVRAAGE